MPDNIIEACGTVIGHAVDQLVAASAGLGHCSRSARVHVP